MINRILIVVNCVLFYAEL